MKIVVINGTQVKGCTYQIKEIFLEDMRAGNEIQEFDLPKDLPHFCCGCKVCIMQSEHKCPHAAWVVPIWEAMMAADLLVFSTPTYALRTTAQMKALLDHLCVHWMVHRPEKAMFSKRAVVLANAIGPVTGDTCKDIATSLSWLGVASIQTCGVGLMEGVIWAELSEKRRNKISKKFRKLAQRAMRPASRSIVVLLKFAMCKALHQAFAKKENPLSADNRHWVEQGWIRVPPRSQP